MFKIIFYLVFILKSALAANSYQVNNSTQVEIDEHAVCIKISNNTGGNLMVPTRTSMEFTSFINNATIPGLTKSSCALNCASYNLATCNPVQGCQWLVSCLTACTEIMGQGKCITHSPCGWTSSNACIDCSLQLITTCGVNNSCTWNGLSCQSG